MQGGTRKGTRGVVLLKAAVIALAACGLLAAGAAPARGQVPVPIPSPTVDHFVVVAVDTIPAGAPFPVSVTAVNSAGLPVPGYGGTITFSSTDPQAQLPGPYTFGGLDLGSHTFLNVSLRTAGLHTISVSSSDGTGTTQLPVLVTGLLAHHLTLSGPASVTAGVPFPLTVSARDRYENLAPVYLNLVTFSSSDPQAQTPASYVYLPLDLGVHTFMFELRTAGVQTITASDVLLPVRDGVYTAGVAPGSAVHFVVGAPSGGTAGQPVTITVTAVDGFGNTATAYTGGVHFSSSDQQAGLPADYAFTPADQGVHAFPVTFRTAGPQTVTATDPNNPSLGGTASVDVAAGPATHLSASAPASGTSGAALTITLAARDAFENLAAGYRGTLHFTSSDAQADLPADYAFTAGDNGSHAFGGIVLRTAGTQTVTATDTGNGALRAEATISVGAGAASSLALSGPSQANSNTPIAVTVTARDAASNVATGFRGTVHFTSSDAGATLPADYTFTAADQGLHAFTASLAAGGTQTISAADTGSGSVAGTLTIVVNRRPLAADDSARTRRNTPVDVPVLANDSDPDQDPLGISALGQPAHGQSTQSAGIVTYTPEAEYAGADSFTYTVDDGRGGSATATVSVLITRLDAAAMVVDAAAGLNSNGNRVLEAGESVGVAPSWSNLSGGLVAVTGTASNWTGPNAGHGVTYSLGDATADYGSIGDGDTANCDSATGDCFTLGVEAGARPLLHWDGTFTETLSNGDSMSWTLHVGQSFTDMPQTNGFYRFVETLLHRHVTGGCGASTYCPSSPSTRAQMAAFTLVARDGVATLPPACVAGSEMFQDVPASNGFCRFIEELARRGAVSGCGTNPSRYCPEDAVTREQMAVFVLRTLDPALVPPACVAGGERFQDVPASSGFCRYIEELARRNVVTGCSVSPSLYCPAVPVTREQMSVFITLTFGLTLYGL